MSLQDLQHRPVILLVEDEPLLRFFVSDLLDDAGFEVIETGAADEALTWLEVRDDVRVIVTDMQMPSAAELPAGGRFVAKPCEGSLVLHHLREMIASTP